jgi:hypothetical protein
MPNMNNFYFNEWSHRTQEKQNYIIHIISRLCTFVIVYHSLRTTIKRAVTVALATGARTCDTDTEINTNGGVRTRVYKEIKTYI